MRKVARTFSRTSLLIVLCISCWASTGYTSPVAAVPAAPATSGLQNTSVSPVPLCQQLGGTLACKPAEPTAWAYIADGIRYGDEASAYAHMLDRHEPASVFALAFRWGSAPPELGKGRHIRSIETASWKIFRRCQSHHEEHFCDAIPNYTGYQRVRDIACPPGFTLGDDSNTAYCLPVAAPQDARTMAPGETAARWRGLAKPARTVVSR